MKVVWETVRKIPWKRNTGHDSEGLCIPMIVIPVQAVAIVGLRGPTQGALIALIPGRTP